MAQLLQAGIRHCGTSVALWVRGYLMVGITLCVFMSQTLLLQPHLKRLSHPKVPRIDPDCSQRNAALAQCI